MTLDITPDRLLGIGMSFWNAKALLSAVELHLFDALAEGPADCETLRRKLGIHERSARDFLDALVAMKVIDRDDRLYRNTPEAEVFLVRSRPSYVGGLLEMANAAALSELGSSDRGA